MNTSAYRDYEDNCGGQKYCTGMQKWKIVEEKHHEANIHRAELTFSN